MVFLELAAARGVVAFLGYYDLIGLSTFAVNLLTILAIAAGTDYAIFLSGAITRPADRRGPRNRLLHDVSRHAPTSSWAPGLTIAGATFCLHFTRLPYFQTWASRWRSACSSPWSPR